MTSNKMNVLRLPYQLFVSFEFVYIMVPDVMTITFALTFELSLQGLDSTSSPGTPVPTPISPSGSLLSTSEGKILPEQIAAGIHRYGHWIILIRFTFSLKE